MTDSFATKIVYRNGWQIGISKGGNRDCRDLQAAAVLPVGSCLTRAGMLMGG